MKPITFIDIKRLVPGLREGQCIVLFCDFCQKEGKDLFEMDTIEVQTQMKRFMRSLLGPITG